MSAGAVNEAAIETLHRSVQEQVELAGLTACQYALAREGQVLTHRTLGDATPSTRFRIMSSSKVLAASVIWQLLGEGWLDLGSPVRRWWPEFGKHGKDNLTIEQVMAFSAGLPNAPLTVDALLDRSLRIKEMEEWELEWEPGTRYEYHGMSAHWIMAELIERTTGQDWRAAIRSRVLAPLSLDRLELGVPAAHQDDLADLTVTGSPPSREQIEQFLGIALPAAPVTATTPGSSFDLQALLSRADVLEAGIPGASGVSDAASLALLYQHLLHDPLGLWDREVLRDATQHPRNLHRDPIGRRAYRSLGLEVAGDDEKAAMRIGAGATSPETFGHSGAGGQVAWADPRSGLSFVFLTSCFDIDFVRQYTRDMVLTRAAAACVA